MDHNAHGLRKNANATKNMRFFSHFYVTFPLDCWGAYIAYPHIMISRDFVLCFNSFPRLYLKDRTKQSTIRFLSAMLHHYYDLLALSVTYIYYFFYTYLTALLFWL